MLTALLTLALAAEPMLERAQPRSRAGIAAVLGAGYGFFEDARAIGPGLSAELGVTAIDRVSVVGRVTFATVLHGIFTGGLSLDIAFDDHWSFGPGLAVSYVGGVFTGGGPSSWSVSVPVRVSFAPAVRAENAVARTGLMLFAELAPGFQFASGPPFCCGIAPKRLYGPPISLVGVAGVGFFWR